MCSQTNLKVLAPADTSPASPSCQETRRVRHTNQSRSHCKDRKMSHPSVAYHTLFRVSDLSDQRFAGNTDRTATQKAFKMCAASLYFDIYLKSRVGMSLS